MMLSLYLIPVFLGSPVGGKELVTLWVGCKRAGSVMRVMTSGHGQAGSPVTD